MPFGDWQFYVVTAVAVWGVWAMARSLLPRRKRQKKWTGLTIEGERPGTDKNR
ncbi:MAG: hypothetical protein HKO59_14760 [Phycisphaerales bacterium]|nr:hypothetical protein [Phycisphaerales bacterium]NNM27219.1 hypothetical protein [Phycisphaerales bacterium]